MALGVSGIISFVMVSINIGYTNLFFSSWIKSWLIAFVLAFISSNTLPFVINKLMSIIFKND
ncbi:DUF2798 domain-containing protein [Enterococcus faecalis]